MHHKTYETNRFFDNWFVNIAGGINVYEGEYDHKVTLGNRLSPTLDISVGKWITPAYGVRLQYAGLQAKGLTTTQSGYAKKQCRNYYKEKFGILNIHTDLMWNWSNAFAGYKEFYSLLWDLDGHVPMVVISIMMKLLLHWVY